MAAVTPPGRAVVERMADRVTGRSPSEPALVRLPAPGRVLVNSAQGPWVVRQDGSKRLLGAYESASWSPRGLFVVATRGRRVVALEPGGDVRWTLTRPARVAQARWAPSGFRIAYREGKSLRVVIGNGEGDRLLASSVAQIAVAWQPAQPRNVLAYGDLKGRVHVVDVDTRQRLWTTRPGPPLTQLVWSLDGRRLLALSSGRRQRLYDASGGDTGSIELEAGHVALRAAFARGGALAYTDFEPALARSSLVVVENGLTRTLIDQAAGRLEDVAWSPNGRWLLVTWPSADQWLFLRGPALRRLVAVSHVSAEFDPGGTGRHALPRLSGWVSG